MSTIIVEPLTITEMKVLVGEDNVGDVQVLVDLDEVIENDLEGFLDILAARVGAPLLTDIDYRVVGVKDGMLVVEVTGDFTLTFEMNEV